MISTELLVLYGIMVIITLIGVLWFSAASLYDDLHQASFKHDKKKERRLNSIRKIK